MDSVRKMQSSQVIPQFQTVEAEAGQTAAPVEATLVDIGTDTSIPTTKQS